MGKLIAYLFFLPSLALAGIDCNRCSSGEGLVLEGVQQPLLGLVNSLKLVNIMPISCIRSQAGQMRLVACYNACGQPGRATKSSTHARGEACDWSGRYTETIQNIKYKLGLKAAFKPLRHGSNQGGGLHEKIMPGYVGYQPTGAPSSAPNAGGTAGAYTPEPGEEYKPPKTMRKVCVRYKDSPWCQEWIRQGNKPGWYEYDPATDTFKF